MRDFLQSGKASVIVGGQWGSEAKGAAAAWVAYQTWLAESNKHSGVRSNAIFDVVTTNAGAQAGHTSIHEGVKRVVYHLPTAPLIVLGSLVYLNAGSIIDPIALEKELSQTGILYKAGNGLFYIHPNAAVITDDCREAEGRPDSAQTKIASTRKGVGEALARKVLRSGQIARDHPFLGQFVRRIDLNERLHDGASVLVEVPQGHGLSVDERFYPYCTSRNCTVGQALSDAGVHPSFVGPIMLVLRTYPIRVGNITEKWALASNSIPDPTSMVGYSGDCYPDQRELTWDELGVPPEITTVTGRVRRVFSWSQQQVVDAMASARPTHVFLSHCDYVNEVTAPAWCHLRLDRFVDAIRRAADVVGIVWPKIVCAFGPSTANAKIWED